MKNNITKGMILAAGLGTRLRPLTLKTPKPLLKVGDKALIEYSISIFAKAGIRDIVINLHHLGNKIKEFLKDGSKYGVKISYSEEKEILGTGGGIRKTVDFFDGEPFVVINGDVIIDIDLKDFVSFHLNNNFAATLVLRKLKDGENYTPIFKDGDRLIEFGRGDMMYTGLQIINPELVQSLKEKSFSDIVSDLYKPYLGKGGDIGAYEFDGDWYDIGTMDRLEQIRALY